MASISLPLPSHTTSTFPHYFDSVDRAPNRHSRRNLTMSTPLPNPHFVFPARDPNDVTDQGPQTTTNTRQPLPDFSFNPGSTDSGQTPAPVPSLNRLSGHRRQYSEFVGIEKLVTPGDTTAGQTNDGVLPTPAKLPPPGPGFSAGNRRRHAHRRSAAISSVDLTAMKNALDVKPYADSAPCTPADTQRESKTPNELSPPLPHLATVSSQPPPPPESPQSKLDGVTSNPQNHMKKRLSDPSVTAPDLPNTSETKAVTQSRTPARKSDITITFSTNDSPPGLAKSRPRPRTADASLMLEQDGSDPTDGSSPTKRPRSAAGHSRAHKSMSAGFLTAASRNSYVEDDDLSPSSLRKSCSSYDSDTSTDDIHETSGSPPLSSKRKSKTKNRQKKVRSWAGSLLIKGKSKRHGSKKGNAEDGSGHIPPPVLTRTNSDFGSGLDVQFDDDNIVVIRTPTNPTHPEPQQASTEVESWDSLENAWKPKSFYEQTTADESRSPVIDLDAALGPFNTPDMGSGLNPETGFTAATKRMYSGGRRGEFVGPEMRYHRRAESAPEMPPIDRAFFGSHRFPTSSSLENPDVFYEEEEDAFLAATSESGLDSEEHLQTGDTPTESNDDKSEHSGESSDTLTRKPTDDSVVAEHAGLGIEKTETNETSTAVMDSKDPHQTETGQPQNKLPSSAQPGPFVRHEDWHARIPAPPSPDVSPRFFPVDYRPVTSPTELPSGIPLFSLHGGCSPLNSAFPSPDFTVSSEPPRSITTSSTTDPFPHVSMEDVPSLTSSASTMTNTLNRVSATFFSRPRLSTDRSASFSAAVHRRSSQPTSKRSSLASLSKLVVGPHAERSKLSHEEKPPGDEPEKAKKKGRRISRLMHFWRMKDKEKLNEPAVRE
ncbi:hypothetical protein BJX99DRAFT_221756 [Aspergillus californicus]